MTSTVKCTTLSRMHFLVNCREQECKQFASYGSMHAHCCWLVGNQGPISYCLCCPWYKGHTAYGGMADFVPLYALIITCIVKRKCTHSHGVCEVCACVRCVRVWGCVWGVCVCEVCKYVCNNFNSRQLKNARSKSSLVQDARCCPYK